MLIEIVGGEGAPWWGVPVVAGVFLLLGGVLGFWFNRVNEDRKEKAALSTRFLDQLLEVCAEQSGRTNEITNLNRKILAAAKEWDETKLDELNELYETRNAEMDLLLEGSWTLELIAPKPIRDASLHLLKMAMVAALSHEPAKLEPALKDLTDATEEFRKQLRKFIHVE